MLTEVHPNSPNATYRVVFDVTFFLFVIVVLLAIVQGIIIDSFGELRDTHNKVSVKKEVRGVCWAGFSLTLSLCVCVCVQAMVDLESNCVVCGASKEILDKNPHGFEKHLLQEHYVWNYLYFFMHLRFKPETEFTGQV